jgi:hypothetical protein
MTTFTTEELHRETERVLATTVREGYTLVGGADGIRFEIRMLPAMEAFAETQRPMPNILERLQKQGMPMLNREQVEAVDRFIAGE